MSYSFVLKKIWLQKNYAYAMVLFQNTTPNKNNTVQLL